MFLRSRHLRKLAGLAGDLHQLRVLPGVGPRRLDLIQKDSGLPQGPIGTFRGNVAAR
jgi:hypothetical protein